MSGSPHFYIVKTSKEVGVYSRLFDARKAAHDDGRATAWEVFDSGFSGALEVVRDGKLLDDPKFQHDRKSEPFTLLDRAVYYTRNGKRPKGLEPLASVPPHTEETPHG